MDEMSVPGDDCFAEAVRLIQQGESKAALSIARQCVASNPEDPSCHDLAGTACLRLKRYQDAADCYREAVRIRPDFAEYHIRLGYALSKMDAIEESLEEAIRALRLALSDYEINRRAAGIFGRAGRVAKAREILESLAERTPKDAGMQENLAAEFARLGDYERAIAHYRRAISADPEAASAFLGLGYALFQSGWLPGHRDSKAWLQAEEACLQAIQLRPEYARAHYDLAAIRAHLRKWEEALPHYRKAMELLPEDMLYRIGTAHCLEMLKQYGEAEILHRSVLEQEPANIQAESRLARVLLKESRVEEAIDHLRHLIEIDTTNHSAYYCLSIALNRLGREEESFEAYMACLRLMQRSKGVQEASNESGHSCYH